MSGPKEHISRREFLRYVGKLTAISLLPSRRLIWDDPPAHTQKDTSPLEQMFLDSKPDCKPMASTSGQFTLYSSGVWETVYAYRQTTGRITDQNLWRLAYEHNAVCGIDPYNYSPDYQQAYIRVINQNTTHLNDLQNRLKTVSGDSQKYKLIEASPLASALSSDRDLENLAQDCLGKIIYLTLDDGRKYPLVVMDVMNSVHVGMSHGFIPNPNIVGRDFNIDLHYQWVEDKMRIHWNSKGQFIKDGMVLSDLPTVVANMYS